MVEIEGLGPLVATHPFFTGMDPSALEIIVGCCANAVFKTGAHLYRQGEPADKFYLIRDGLVTLEVYVGGRPAIAIETVEAGEIVGWSWLVSPYKWSNDARASGTVRAISIDGACLRRKMEADRVLGYEIYKRFLPVMARRLLNNRERIVELATEPAT
ncbi:cyclic nucleotide-binding domain-containing protein [Telmatospirillum sp.]|uniref:cyclic nucleotide-binding domain-containing protein n=1 Tax=Telmatospirillum sp. TaxID=2079197 RepID=UPI0028497609|nr:cyclic nucleotide-binding domain-containing protein [Telmatospirillum sp.]MDR3440895.1 cyclic nucleotide-binding domain-containing protein [Telmatospirillum sp.]